ncbi:MAG: hypothetical protein ABEJ04_03720 [Halobacteriaceae archaeon]
MSGRPHVERSFEEPYLTFRCDCGWEGRDADVAEWDVQADRDRAVRVCPDCGDPAPEWGALRPLAGAALIARGPLREALRDAGVPVK